MEISKANLPQISSYCEETGGETLPQPDSRNLEPVLEFLFSHCAPGVVVDLVETSGNLKSCAYFGRPQRNLCRKAKTLCQGQF